MKDIPAADLLQIAKLAAESAGKHALEHYSRRKDSVSTSQYDIKLQLDIECQDVAESVIKHRFPEHDFLGEEDLGHKESSSSPYRWIIDPIDGTVNFSQGHDMWCNSVAVQQGGETVAAAVCAPMREDLYAASKEQSSTCNGNDIHVSSVGYLNEAMVHSGFDRWPGTDTFAVVNALTHRVRKTRILGSAALDLCFLAAGIADGYFEAGIYLWDIAAAGFIVEQAGGKTALPTPMQDDYRMTYLASNGHIHSELCDLVNTILQGPT